MLYRSSFDAIRYAKQVEKASASLKKESEGEKISGAEFLYGFRKNDKILPVDEERGVTDMCYAMETFKEEAIAEGIERGLKRGIKQGIKQGIEQGRELQREEDIKIIDTLKERIEELESKINND